MRGQYSPIYWRGTEQVTRHYLTNADPVVWCTCALLGRKALMYGQHLYCKTVQNMEFEKKEIRKQLRMLEQK